MIKNIVNFIQLLWRYYKQRWIHWLLKKQGYCISETAMILGKNKFSGDNIYVGKNSIIISSALDGRANLKIGDNVIVDKAIILTAQHDLDTPQYETIYAPVEIGDYALIYQQAIILPGRKIGRGAVVAAGAVVSHDVPEMAVVAGNPAKIVRFRKCIHNKADLRRFNGFIAERLLNMAKRRLEIIIK